MVMISTTERIKNCMNLADKAPPPYGLDLHTVVNFDLWIIAKIKDVPFTVLNQQYQRAEVANWIIKLKINPDYKHPMGKFANKSKTFADVYSAVFDACEKLHTFGGGSHYTNASQWFCLILYEFALCRSNATGKKAAIAEIRKQNASLADLKIGGGYHASGAYLELHEIYDPRVAPHTYSLFEKLLAPVYNKDFNTLLLKLLVNIIGAMKAFTTWCDANVSGVYCVGEDQDFLQFGKGKARRPIQNLSLNPETVTTTVS